MTATRRLTTAAAAAATTTASIVDELGRVRARAADLDLRERELKEELRRLGAGAYEGRLFRATVSEPGERECPDLTWLRGYVGPRLWRAHCETVTVAPTVRVAARNGRTA